MGGELTVAIADFGSRIVGWTRESCWSTLAFLLQAFYSSQQDWLTTRSERWSKTEFGADSNPCNVSPNSEEYSI